MVPDSASLSSHNLVKRARNGPGTSLKGSKNRAYTINRICQSTTRPTIEATVLVTVACCASDCKLGWCVNDDIVFRIASMLDILDFSFYQAGSKLHIILLMS
jgi:hypothetical protein